MCVRALFAHVSESDSFYRFVLCWQTRHELLLTMILMFGFSVKAEGLSTSPLCLSVHSEGMLRMTERTAHITYRCHYITKFAALCQQDK